MNRIAVPSAISTADLVAAVTDPMSVPAGGAAAVTKSDTTALAGVRALYVGGGGDILATVGGVDVTFVGVPTGTILPIQATKVKAATTATNIVALS